MTEKITASQIKTKLETLIKKKFKYDKEDFFKALKYGSDFDWEKYAKAIASKDTSIFEFEKDDTDSEIQEKSFMQILNQLFTNEDVMTAADIDMDDIISGKELEEYFSTLSTLDGNGDDISLDDISKLIEDKEIDLDKTDAGKEALEAEQAQAAAAGGGVGGGGGGGNVSTSTGDENSSPAPTDNPQNTYNEQATQDPIQALKGQIHNNENALGSLISSTSNDFTDINSSALSNVPEKEKAELIAKAQAKNEAQSAMNDAKASLPELTNDEAALVENYTALSETLAQTTEQKNTVDVQLQGVNDEITNLNTSIQSLSGQISSLTEAYNSIEIPSANEDNSNASDIASAKAKRAYLKSRIDALKAQKTGQEQALTAAEANKQQLEGQQVQLQVTIDNTNTQIAQAEQELSQIQGDNLEAIQEYTSLVQAYQTASAEYNQAKAAAMSAMQQQIAVDKQTYTQETIKNQEEETQTCFIDNLNEGQFQPNVAEGSMFATYSELHDLLEKGEITPEDIENIKDPTAKEIALAYYGDGSEDYPGFKDEQKEKIKECFGSEENYFKILVAMKQVGAYQDENGNIISYGDILLNPENYSNITPSDLEEYKESFDEQNQQGYDFNHIDAESIEGLVSQIVDDFRMFLNYPEYAMKYNEESGVNGYLMAFCDSCIYMLDDNGQYIFDDNGIPSLDYSFINDLYGLAYCDNIDEDTGEDLSIDEEPTGEPYYISSTGEYYTDSNLDEYPYSALATNPLYNTLKGANIEISSCDADSFTIPSDAITPELLETLGIDDNDPAKVKEQLEAKGFNITLSEDELTISIAQYSIQIDSGTVTPELLEILGIDDNDPAKVKEQLEAKGFDIISDDEPITFGKSVVKLHMTPAERAAKYGDMGISIATYGDESMTLASGVVTDEFLETLGIEKDDPNIIGKLEEKGFTNVNVGEDGSITFGEATIKYDDLQ